MSDWFADVLEFHRKLAPERIGDHPSVPAHGLFLLMKLINEEIHETFDAMFAGDPVGVADGIVDSIYVLIGAAVTYGIDLRPIWDAVHRANMAKTGGPTREDGKVLKPPGWTPSDVAGLIEAQMKGPGLRHIVERDPGRCEDGGW